MQWKKGEVGKGKEIESEGERKGGQSEKGGRDTGRKTEGETEWQCFGGSGVEMVWFIVPPVEGHFSCAESAGLKATPPSPRLTCITNQSQHIL